MDNTIYVWDGINGCFEEFSNMEEVEEYVRENYMEDGEVHMDIDSIIILKRVGGVTVEQTGETTILHGEEVPIVKVKIGLD